MKKFRLLFVIAFSLFIALPFKVSAMEIYVKPMNGNNITIDVEQNDYVEVVKTKIQNVLDIPSENQKLIFGGTQLEDGKTLQYYNIQKESTIHLIYTLKLINVKYNIENLNVITDNVTSEGDLGNNNYIVYGTKNFTAKLVAIDGYELPRSINVKINENIVDAEKYSYNFETGEIFINKDLIEGDIEIEANAVKIEYKVTFDANGGKFGNDTIYTIDNWSVNLYDNLTKPTRDGYTFKGYYTEKIGGTKFEMILNESGIDSDMTFYAQWEENSGAGTSTPEEENPKTFDGIGSSIFMGTISLIGLVGATIYLKRRNKVRA